MGDESRSARVARLRSAYPQFVYERFHWHRPSDASLECSFELRAGPSSFRPTYRFTFGGRRRARWPRAEVVDNLVFHLGLAELASYWKATCSPRVEVRAGALPDEQAAFWTRLLTEGMGEFHYTNGTDGHDPGFVSVVGDGSSRHAVFVDRLEPGYVVPVGGGKDSLVTLDLLAGRCEHVTTFAINPPPSTTAAIELAAAGACVLVERRLDPRLRELNAKGFLNGHTPFGIVVGIGAALAAVVLGHAHVVLSNEASSDHPTRVDGDRVVNHQYGKSWAFEVALRDYLARYIANDLEYFSLLRPFNELQIAQRFAELRSMHGVFRSCNRGRATDTWCGRCPKCVSTFVVLAPFLERSTLTRSIGDDLLSNPASRAMLPALLGEPATERPFECVATPAEIRAALDLCEGESLAPSTIEVLTRRVRDHFVPGSLYEAADGTLRPRVWPLLRTARVGVLGLGLEGTSTSRYLLARQPGIDLTLLDDDDAARDRVATVGGAEPRLRFVCAAPGADSNVTPELDVIFRSPGVPPDHRVLRRSDPRRSLITSNTELFFERCRGTTIGVTGTKGKSTTTSLIAHVLHTAGRDVRLVGNIGTPCIDDLDVGDTSTIYCVELAAFQLDSLRVSPSIAVVLGVFPDHLDRYGDLAAYVGAKSSIARYQTRTDLVIYNADCPRATQIAGGGVARRIAFRRDRPEILAGERGPLLGEFNNYNLWPSIWCGRTFGLSDDEIAVAIRSFRPLPGRLETVAETERIRFVCDIRSTAPEVTIAALEALTEDDPGVSRVEFVLLGGVDRQQDYRSLVEPLVRAGVRHVILFPPTGRRIRELLEATDLREPMSLYDASSMADAIAYVDRHAHPPVGRPSICLMSTAAPSTGGLFSGPEDKARQFAALARAGIAPT